MSGSVVDRLSAALRAHVDARRRAEERLSSFAFSERPGASIPGAADDATDGSPDWRHFAARTLRVAGDPGALRVLDRLRDGPVATAVLAGALDPDERGRLALVDRIGELAAAGLVARELERDEVTLAPLGEAVLDLVAEIERREGVDAS